MRARVGPSDHFPGQFGMPLPLWSAVQLYLYRPRGLMPLEGSPCSQGWLIEV